MADAGDIRALRTRLAECEAALAAIRAGELDALVGGDAPEHAIYSHPSAEQSYRLMIEHMREGALTVSAEGQDTILYCNLAFAEMVGLPLEHTMGRRLESFIEPSERNALQWLLEGDEDRRQDVGLRAMDGRHVPVSISSALVRSSENIRMRCLVVADLTDRKDVERLRQAQRDLELAAQRKDEFIAMLGHELRNPLAPIRQAAELLEEQGDDAGMKELGRAREVIVRQVGHLRRLVDDLLDAGRITRGTLRLRIEPVALSEVVAASVESVRRLVDRRDHRLEIRLPSEPIYIRADAVRMTQVLSNVLSNAAKFSAVAGNICLTARKVADEVCIEVRDHGRGIRPELLSRIFEPFVQDDVRLDRSIGGLGVGLTLVRRVVEMHHGRVQAHSEGLGRGSTFVVHLPLAEPPPRPEPSRPVRRVETSAERRILVCDDNVDAAEMLALVLRRRGHQVQVTYDGEEALAAALAAPPHLACLDIGLPGMDGFEVARRMRADPKLSDIMLIALTGYGQQEDRRRSAEAGFDHHLVKPVGPEELDRVLNSSSK